MAYMEAESKFARLCVIVDICAKCVSIPDERRKTIAFFRAGTQRKNHVPCALVVSHDASQQWIVGEPLVFIAASGFNKGNARRRDAEMTTATRTGFLAEHRAAALTAYREAGETIHDAPNMP